jgi:diacylglycerol O-acyltransferase
VSLATDIGDPLRRLEAIKRSLAQARSDRVSLPAQAGSTYALLRAAPLIAKQLPGVGRLVPAVFNLSISTTEGSEQTRYCNGARLEAVYTMSQLMQSRALSIDCVSYGSTLNIGIIGARDTLPHLQRLAVYMGKAVDDLEELVELGGAAA